MYSSVYRYGYEIIKSNDLFLGFDYTGTGKYFRTHYGKQCCIPGCINILLIFAVPFLYKIEMKDLI